MEKISDISTNAPHDFDKSKAKKHFLQLQERLPELQNLFYAEAKHALLIILQGMGNYVVANTIVATLDNLKMQYPQ